MDPLRADATCSPPGPRPGLPERPRAACPVASGGVRGLRKEAKEKPLFHVSTFFFCAFPPFSLFALHYNVRWTSVRHEIIIIEHLLVRVTRKKDLADYGLR